MATKQMFFLTTKHRPTFLPSVVNARFFRMMQESVGKNSSLIKGFFPLIRHARCFGSKAFLQSPITLTPDSGNDAESQERRRREEKMAIIFTCNVCETRSAKQFSKKSYETGVVLVRCPGCDNLHLIADRLGFFEDKSVDIVSLMQSKGIDVKRISDMNDIDFSVEDIVGQDCHNHATKE